MFFEADIVSEAAANGTSGSCLVLAKHMPPHRSSMGHREFRSLGRLRELQFPAALSMSDRCCGVISARPRTISLRHRWPLPGYALKAGEHVVSE